MNRIISYIFIVTALTRLGPLGAQDRQISPTKGFQPAHSYALDSIESIDKGTGTLSLHIPITALPPGRAGFTAGVTLSYNNRYWDAEAISLTSTEYDLINDEQSSGGWRLSMSPKLDTQIVAVVGLGDQCQSGDINNPTVRLSIIEEDGSRHMLYRSAPAPVAPIEQYAACLGTYQRSNMNTVQSKWFTTDGSFLRVVIDAPTPNAPGGWPENAKWTMYRRDGSSVTYDPNPTVRKTFLRDKNGNTIEISAGILNGVSYEEMRDPFNRWVRIDRQTVPSLRDVVTQPAHDGSTLTWIINWVDFPVITTPTTFKSKPGANDQLDFNSGPHLVSSVELPNGRSYTFGHGTSRYRELATMTMPTGASVQYGYRLDTTTSVQYYHQILANTVASKSITHDGVNEQWQYSYYVGSTGTYSTAKVTAPDGGETWYEFNPISYQYSALPSGGTITRAINPDGSEVQREWVQNRPAQLPGAVVGIPNQWVQKEWTTIANSTPTTASPGESQTLNLLGTPTATSLKVYSVDKNGNTTIEEERGWLPYPSYTSTANALLRKTLFTYRDQSGDSTSSTADVNSYSHPDVPASPRDLVASKEVQSGSGATAARSEFYYTAVGNLQDEWHWDSAKAGSGTPLSSSNAIHRSYTYTGSGNLQTETNPRGYVTTYSYSSTDGCGIDLYRTGMSRGGNGSVPQTFIYKYNSGPANNGCNTGLRTDSTDPNAIKTSVVYDRFGRPNSFTEGSSRKTTHEYNDSSLWIVTRNDVDVFNDEQNVSVMHFDQLGRVRQTRQLEASVSNSVAASDETLGIRTDRRYVFQSGRNDVLVSNPYRHQSEGTAPTRGWTVSRRDKAGRLCFEETFGGAAEPTTPTLGVNCLPSSGMTGSTSYSYTARSHQTQTQPVITTIYRSETIVDGSGSGRTLYYDVLGRVSGVWEDPGSLRYFTTYGYDLNNNLTSVLQAGICDKPDPAVDPCVAGQQRAFNFSSLNRLISANNPESGAILYQYDDAGNLTRREQGGVTRCAGTSIVNGSCQGAGFDDLDRPLALAYNDGTPSVTYTYDTEVVSARPGACTTGTRSPKGRLSSISNSASSSYFYYSELGYPQCHRQLTNGQSYDFGYTTTPQGAIRTTSLPSGRQVSRWFDAAGRIVSVTSGSTVYAGVVLYASNGEPREIPRGNNLTETWSYNSRLQPTQMQARSTSGSNLLTIGLAYCPSQGTSCSTNNGNVRDQTIFRGAHSWTQSFSYDKVNRLAAASETNSTGTWSQSFGYDAKGNRWINGYSGTGFSTLTLESPQAASWFTGDNRITSWGYDTRGNVTGVASMNRSFTYDGENRQITATINGQTSNYSYDGEGRRVKAVTPGGIIVFVYDMEGQLAAEYGANLGSGTQYITTDHLGSTRLITTVSTVNGSVVPAISKESDYLPFGEELRSGMGGSARGASFDGLDNRLKFTGKERDAETGLDYFGARYFSGAQGRFTSPDAPFADQHTIDPQSWNLYAYVRNNPLKNTDPNGRDCFQGAVSCANYVLGGVGAVANAFTSGLVNLPNRLADGLVAPFNGGQRVFGDLVPDAFTPTNTDQRQGMEAANAVMLVSPLVELGAARAVSATAVEIPQITQNAARGAASEARVLSDMGVTKNTTSVANVAGKKSIPDINTSTMVGDVKDVKVVSNTQQMRIQREVAGKTGREHVIVTGTNTHVTAPTQKPPTRIIRRDDLGPQQ